MIRRLATGLCVLLLSACAVEGGPDSTPDATQENVDQSTAALTIERSFGVDFTNCTEIASLTPVPIARLRPLVPAKYAITNEANGVGFVVVRISTCQGVKVGAVNVGAGTVAQVGVNIVGTDDIDNYTIYYDTTSPLFSARLRAFGFESRALDIDFDNTGTAVSIRVPERGYSVTGPVVPPTAPPVPFVADWYAATRSSESKTDTPIQAIQFSTADLTLHTRANSQLRSIIGAPDVGFPIFDSYNKFASAHMTVSRQITFP